jgi:RNA polymerase sigma-70 factor, ECF subfamily
VNRLLQVVPPPAGPPVGEGDDERLVAGLRAGERWAADALVERYGPLVRRILFRVFGSDDSEQADLAQEIFTRAWQGVGQLSDPRALKPWLTRIAVFTARGAIRHRSRRRWLSFFDSVPEPDPSPSWAGPDMREAAGCVYRIFERLPVDERLPYVLRVMGGLDLDETADACGTSLSTVRRRLAKAEARFFKLARQYEALVPWLDEGRKEGET